MGPGIPAKVCPDPKHCSRDVIISKFISAGKPNDSNAALLAANARDKTIPGEWDRRLPQSPLHNRRIAGSVCKPGNCAA